MKNMTKTTIAVMLILVFVFNFPINIYSTVQEAKNTALALALVLAGRYGLNVRDTFNYGELQRGESYYLTITLYYGSDYYLVAGGCSYATDIDLYLYDENWNLIDRDRRSDEKAEVSVTPDWTGTFHIKVTMYGCTSSTAHWALVYAYR